MLDGIRRWWHSLRHPDQSVHVACTTPITKGDIGGPPPPPPADSPAPIRVKVVCTGPTARNISVTDADTGRPISVFAADWSWDIRNHRAATLTLKTYLRDFSYEGPASVLTFCPKCKAEAGARREAHRGPRTIEVVTPEKLLATIATQLGEEKARETC
jgi:hypothetical protein